MGVTKVDADISGYSELVMVGEFYAPMPRKRGHQPVGQVLDLVDESAHNAVAVLAFYFDQHDKTRSAFNQSGDVAVLGTAEQIALPVSRDRAIFNFRWSVPNRNRTDNLPPRLPCGRCSSAPPHDPAAA